MMTTGLAKLGTGLAACGLGLPLRATAFAAVAWGEWKLVPLGQEWIRTAAVATGIQDESGAVIVLTILTFFCLALAAMFAVAAGVDGRESSPSRPARKAWRLRDFLWHAPFACWRLITHGGVPVWAILALPVILAVDLFLVVEVLFVMLVQGLWLAITFRFGKPKPSSSTRAGNSGVRGAGPRRRNIAWSDWVPPTPPVCHR